MCVPVVISIVCSFKFHVNHVTGKCGTGYINNLHDGVVGRDENGEQVQITSAKYGEEKDLKDRLKSRHKRVSDASLNTAAVDMGTQSLHLTFISIYRYLPCDR